MKNVILTYAVGTWEDALKLFDDAKELERDKLPEGGRAVELTRIEIEK